MPGARGPAQGSTPRWAAEPLPRVLYGALAATLLLIEAVYAAWRGASFLSDPVLIGGAMVAVGLAAGVLARDRIRGADTHIVVASLFAGTGTFFALRWLEGPDPFLVTAFVYVPLVCAVLLRPAPTALYGVLTIALMAVMRALAPGGHVLGVEAFVFAYVIVSVSVAGSWAIHRDRAALKDAERETAAEAAMLQEIMDGLPDALWVVDKELGILRENDAAARLCPGGSRRSLHDIMPARWTDSLADHAANAAEGPQWWRFHDPERDAKLEVLVHGPSDGPYVVVSFRDVTERHTAQQAQEAAAVSTRAATMNLVTHQIRTPLTAAILKAHVLRAGGGGSLTKKQYRSLNVIVDAMERASRNVDLYVESARLAAQAPDRTAGRVRVAAALEEAFKEHGEGALQNDVPDDIDVATDPTAAHVSLGVMVQCLGTDHVGPLHAWAQRDGHLIRLHLQPIRAEGPFHPVLEPDAEGDEGALARTVAKAAVEQHWGHFAVRRNAQGDEQWRLTWPIAQAESA